MVWIACVILKHIATGVANRVRFWLYIRRACKLTEEHLSRVDFCIFSANRKRLPNKWLWPKTVCWLKVFDTVEGCGILDKARGGLYPELHLMPDMGQEFKNWVWWKCASNLCCKCCPVDALRLCPSCCCVEMLFIPFHATAQIGDNSEHY